MGEASGLESADEERRRRRKFGSETGGLVPFGGEGCEGDVGEEDGDGGNATEELFAVLLRAKWGTLRGADNGGSSIDARVEWVGVKGGGVEGTSGSSLLPLPLTDELCEPSPLSLFMRIAPSEPTVSLRRWLDVERLPGLDGTGEGTGIGSGGGAWTPSVG